MSNFTFLSTEFGLGFSIFPDQMLVLTNEYSTISLPHGCNSILIFKFLLHIQTKTLFDLVIKSVRRSTELLRLWKNDIGRDTNCETSYRFGWVLLCSDFTVPFCKLTFYYSNFLVMMIELIFSYEIFSHRLTILELRDGKILPG